MGGGGGGMGPGLTCYATAKVRRFLHFNDTEKLIHAFISSRLDYCNAFYFFFEPS